MRQDGSSSPGGNPWLLIVLVPVIILLVFILLVSCSPKVSSTSTPTAIPVSSPTAVSTATPLSDLTRGERILELAKDRPGYYDKTDIYLDLVGFHPEDLPNCAFPFYSVMLATGGVVIEQHEGFAVVMGELGENVFTASFLVPTVPSEPPPPPPASPGGDLTQTPVVTKEDLANWQVFLALVTEDGTVSLTLKETYPDLRISTLVPLSGMKERFDKFVAQLPAACKNPQVGSGLLSPLDFLMIAGFDFGEGSSARYILTPIGGRVRAVSNESKGFYFDGTILPDDMGGLVFVFRVGKPELVGVVTGANWPLGYETFNFATNIGDVLSTLNKDSSAP